MRGLLRVSCGVPEKEPYLETPGSRERPRTAQIKVRSPDSVTVTGSERACSPRLSLRVIQALGWAR